MRLLDEQTAEAYLREHARVGAREPVIVRELWGGVSNMVLFVERPERPGEAFVLKQARAQLRTSQPWFSSVERIWREADVLTICADLLEAHTPEHRRDSPIPAARTPRILFEDRENYLFAMTAAPRASVVWKAELLAGRVEPRIAAACGALLGTLHGKSWRDEAIRQKIGDATLFDQLRIDPYYRTLAATRPETRGAVNRVMASLAAHPLALVHADFSPKNLLVHRDGLLMVDFETGHYGDPAFDLGFFLSHLMLKACLKMPGHAPYLELSEIFEQSYRDQMSPRIPPEELSELWARGVRNFALCAWARLNGKSPVEYLSDEGRRDSVRGLCLEILTRGVRTWPDVVELAARRFTP